MVVVVGVGQGIRRERGIQFIKRPAMREGVGSEEGGRRAAHELGVGGGDSFREEKDVSWINGWSALQITLNPLET